MAGAGEERKAKSPVAMVSSAVGFPVPLVQRGVAAVPAALVVCWALSILLPISRSVPLVAPRLPLSLSRALCLSLPLALSLSLSLERAAVSP